MRDWFKPKENVPDRSRTESPDLEGRSGSESMPVDAAASQFPPLGNGDCFGYLSDEPNCGDMFNSDSSDVEHESQEERLDDSDIGGCSNKKLMASVPPPLKHQKLDVPY